MTFDFPVVIERTSKKQNTTITIKPDQKVIVRASWFVSNNHIFKFVSEKENWIKKHLSQQKSPPFFPKAVRNGSVIYYLGNPYKIHISPGEVTSFKLKGNFLVISRKENDDLRQPLKDYMKSLSKKLISDRVQDYAKRLGHYPRALFFKETTTRYGSCTANGDLNFHWPLISAPLFVIDYIVAHELCHLIVMDHSSSFWKRVAMLYPAYKQANRWLKQNGYRLLTSGK